MKKFIVLFITIFALFIHLPYISAECIPRPTPMPDDFFSPCPDDYDKECTNDVDLSRWCCTLRNDECMTQITEAPGPPADIENVELPKYSDLEGFIGRFRWGDDATIGDIISTLLPLIFVLAGIILLVYILIGGFILLTSAGNPKSVQKGQKMLTNGIIGFLIVLASYWIAQIFQTILSINILG